MFFVFAGFVLFCVIFYVCLICLFLLVLQLQIVFKKVIDENLRMASPYRLALSEIPGRLASLHVVAEDHDFAEEDREEVGENNNVLLNGTTVSSPDEYVIRQRGRRRITLSWSPDKVSAQNRSPFEKTPTKIQTTMTLRSSPRKRLMISGDQEDNSILEERSPRRKPITPVKNLWSASPMIKKTRLGEEEQRPLAQSASFDVPLSTLLLGLSQDQLIGMIQNIAGSDVKLENKIRNGIPLPDLR